MPLAEKVAARCAEKGVAGRTVTLKVKYDDFEQITRRRTLPGAIDDADDMVEVAAALLAELAPFPKAVRLLGVSVSGFAPDLSVDTDQMDLFAPSGP